MLVASLIVRRIHPGGPYIGLVRAVDRAGRRLVYGLGRVPAGVAAGELGSLASRPFDGAIAVWHTADGRLVTDPHGSAPPQRKPLKALSTAVEPVRWREHGRAVRARAVVKRLVELGRASAPARRTPPGAGKVDGPPSGYLLPGPGPGTRPLLSAIHPATGDQLLTTSAREAEALGYVGVTELGHLRAAAPVTGTLGPGRAAIPWARRFGLGSEPPESLLGSIELPLPGADEASETLRIAGWALAVGDRVRRAEVFIDGRPAGNARLGLPRGDLAAHPPVAGQAEALLAGFELVPASGQVPADDEPVDICVLITTMKGETLVLGSEGVRLTRVVAPEASDTPLRRAARPRVNGHGRGLLAFAHRLDHGGAQRYFADQVLRLRPGFDRCTVVAFHDGAWREPLERAGIEVHVTSQSPRSGRGEYEGRLDELRAWCGERAPAVAFVNTLDCFMGADLAKRLGLPVVWALHESFDPATWWAVGHGWSPEQAYILDRIEQALAGADATVFAADATRRLYEPYIDVERSVVLPYGIELGALDEFRASFDRERARDRLGLDRDTRIVLCLAILSQRKGQALLTQAFGMVADRHPDARLLLVGDVPGAYSSTLRRYIDGKGLGERVRLVPTTPDAYTWHGLADVFALASDVESSPLSLLEAMAFETPALASRVFGVPELIEDERNGFMFEPNDLGELAEGLDRVLGMDPAELAGVARAGAETVRERHDPDRYGERLADLVRSLEGTPDAARP